MAELVKRFSKCRQDSSTRAAFMNGSFVRKYLKRRSICQSQRCLLRWPGGRLVEWNHNVFTIKSLCRQRMCDFYRHADRKKRETGTSVDGWSGNLQEKANFELLQVRYIFPLFTLFGLLSFFLYYSFYSLFVLYLISPEQVFHGTLGNLIWLSSTVFKPMAGNLSLSLSPLFSFPAGLSWGTMP